MEITYDSPSTPSATWSHSEAKSLSFIVLQEVDWSLERAAYMYLLFCGAHFADRPQGRKEERKQTREDSLAASQQYFKSDMTYLCNMSFLNLFAHIRREQIFLVLVHLEPDDRNLGNETNIVQQFTELSDFLKPILFWEGEAQTGVFIRRMQLLCWNSISRTDTTSKSPPYFWLCTVRIE